jgi:hypothetical protein
MITPNSELCRCWDGYEGAEDALSTRQAFFLVGLYASGIMSVTLPSVLSTKV